MRTLGSLGRDSRAVTAVEFAVVAPVMLMIIFGLLELAFQAFAQGTLDGAVNEGARGGTIEINAGSQSGLDARVASQVQSVIPSATVTFDRANYSSVADIAKREDFQDAPPLNDRWDTGECFEDYNGNGRYDLDRGRAGQGGADDFVRYEVTAQYQRFFPVGLLGLDSAVTLKSRSVLRNQPYSAQSAAAVVCS